VNLRRRFERFRAPGEDDAQERSWRVARAAFEESRAEPAPARRRLNLRPAAALAAGAAALALVVTPAGPALADWIEDVVSDDGGDSTPAPLRLPAEGRMIVNTQSGPWIVHRDGSKRLLGAYGDASWSPMGLFVVATRGRDLYALEPGGRVRWQVPAPRPVRSPRWAPSGFRIAYLSGSALRVVAGDGTGDRRFERAGPTPPAWRPGARHVLAYADPSGRVNVADVDSGRTLWQSAPGGRIRELAWSADAMRLVAVTDASVRVFSGSGEPLHSLPGGQLMAFDPTSHTFAVVRRPRRGETEVVLLTAGRSAGHPRRVFAGPGGVSGVAWSPDGRWLLIQWTGSDQWLFVSTGADRRVRAADRMSERFNPGDPAGPQVPHRTEWCC
jgi:hypothetical protein